MSSEVSLSAKFTVDANELRLRHQKLFAAMEEGGVDRYLHISGPFSPMGVNYATNFETFGLPSLVCIDRDDQDVTLYTCSEYDARRARLESPVDNIRFVPDLASTIGQLLNEKQQSAIGGLHFSSREFVQRCQNEASRQLSDSSRILERAATTKTKLELQLIRQSAKIADAGFRCAQKAARAGMRDFELSAEIEYSMRQLGAIENFGLLGTGPHNKAMGLPSGRLLAEKDTLIFEITPAIVSRNYSAQLCKTLVIGEFSDALIEKHQILEEAFRLAVGAIRPGIKVADVVEIQDQVISSYGYGEYCRPPYMRSRGHGFGVGRTDHAPGNTQVLESGMAFIVHPNQYFPDVGYLALGQMVTVTDDGVELLSGLPTGLSDGRLKKQMPVGGVQS